MQLEAAGARHYTASYPEAAATAGFSNASEHSLRDFAIGLAAAGAPRVVRLFEILEDEIRIRSVSPVITNSTKPTSGRPAKS